MVAVLPMSNLTGDASVEHVVDGFTDAIINQLACADPRDLSVIAYTSVIAYKGERKTISELAHDLGIEFALESSLRISGEQILISAQLIRADLQTHIWARDYRRERRDLMGIQSEIGATIAHEISLTLAPQQQKKQLGAKVVLNPEAYEMYLKGRYFWNQRTEEALVVGIGYFDRAIALEPTHAAAHSGLSACWVFNSVLRAQRPSEGFPRAKACATRALELDPRSAEAHTTLGMVYVWNEFDWCNGEREFKRAIELEPGNATSHTWFAIFLASMCRHGEALREIGMALRIDPLSWAVRAVSAFIQEWTGNGLAAISELKKALELNPRYGFARMQLGFYSLTVLGNPREAVAQLRRACDDCDRHPDVLSCLGCIYAIVGSRQEALQILDELSKTKRYVSPYFPARIHVFLGDFEKALDLLDEAFEEKFFFLTLMQKDPTLRPLAEEPRFRNLMRKMGFPSHSAGAHGG